MNLQPACSNIEEWYQDGSVFHWKKHDVFYRIFGKGSPLLLIHGFPTSSWDWNESVPELAKHFSVIVFDLLDYGRSKNHCRERCSIMDQMDMIEALLDSLGISALDVLAHDVGDTVAQEMLARHNEGSLKQKMKSLILLNGGMLPDEHRPRKVQKKLISPYGRLYSYFMKKEKITLLVAAIHGPDTKPKKEDYQKIWELAVGVNGRPSLARRIHYMSERQVNKTRWVGALTEAKIPMMIINGGADPVSGAHAADALEKLLPHVPIKRLPRIGHFPPTEAPEAVVAFALEFYQLK